MYFPACGFTPVAYKVFVQPVDGGKFFMSSLLDDLPLIDNKYLIRLMTTTLIINQKHKITMINALIVFIMMYAVCSYYPNGGCTLLLAAQPP